MKWKRKFRELIYKLISSTIPYLIPKNRKKIIFGSMNGQYYGDNSKHLYEWILANRKDLAPIWVTKNKNVFKYLRSEGRPVKLANTYSSIYHLFTAKVGLFTNSLKDIALHPNLVPKTIKLIALRHGRSVKKIRFARENHKLSKEEAYERKRESDRICYVISTSEFISDIQEKCLRVGREKHIVTGYPRNDQIFSPCSHNFQHWKTYLGNLKPSKVVLYGPSWRHGRNFTQFFPFDDFDAYELKNYLEKNNILLLLRPHMNEYEKSKNLVKFLKDLSSLSPNIRLCMHDDFADVNTLLPFVDILISDYSALYHDFLLLDKPMIFIPYDYDEFKKQNGFLYDYFKNLPGKSVGSFNDFLHELNNLCIGEDKFIKKRQILRDKIHAYQNGSSCERVVDLVDSILENKVQM